ncbi:MAG: 3TM-type holin [Syntrophobacteraceae bacterium]
MSLLAAIPIVGKVVSQVLGIIDQAVPDKDQAAKLKQELSLAVIEKDFSFVEKEIQARAQIISAEAQGASFLQRNWRPILMLTFTYIIAHNYVLSPMFSLQRLDIPPDMWELLKLGMGGYIIGRTAEKAVETWKKG